MAEWVLGLRGGGRGSHIYIYIYMYIISLITNEYNNNYIFYTFSYYDTTLFIKGDESKIFY